MANANTSTTSISGAELLDEVSNLLDDNLEAAAKAEAEAAEAAKVKAAKEAAAKAESAAKEAAAKAAAAKAAAAKAAAAKAAAAKAAAAKAAEMKAAEMKAAAKAAEVAMEAAKLVAEAKPIAQPVARVELTKAKPNDDFDITEVHEEDEEEMLACEDNEEENDENDEEENVQMNTTSTIYPSGTPSFIIDLLNEDKSTATKISLAVKEAKKNEEIKHWAATLGQRGMPKKELREYSEVKKGVREAFGITNAQIIRPTTTTTLTKSQVKKAVTIVKEEGSILEALTPKKTPIKKFINQRTGQTYLLWTDLLISTCKDYELRLRKFTEGENSKPTDAIPNVYLMKGEQVLLTLNMNEYIVMINMNKQLQTENKMDEIFQAVLALRA